LREEVSMSTLRPRRVRRCRQLLFTAVGLVAWFGALPATADSQSGGLLPEVKGVQVVRTDEQALELQLPGGIPPHEVAYLAPAVLLLGLSAGLRVICRRPAVCTG
jgi:hypothetical protein